MDAAGPAALFLDESHHVPSDSLAHGYRLAAGYLASRIGDGTADIINVSSLAGRVPIAGSAVYSLTKHGVGAFTESLRQEVTGRHVRVSLIEPGPVATELFTHIRPEILEASKDAFADATLLHAKDIADAITYAVTRPARVVLSELLIRPDASQW